MTKAIFREDGMLTGYGNMEMIRLSTILKPQFHSDVPHEVAALLHAIVEELRCEAVLEAKDERTCDSCGWMREGICEHDGDCLEFAAWRPK